MVYLQPPLHNGPPANIRTNFTSPETRMTVLTDTKNHMIVPLSAWTKHQNVTDRGTDGQISSGCYSPGTANNAHVL